MKFKLGLLAIALSLGLAACDENPFASKEKRDKKHSRDRDDDDDDKPRSKASASASGARTQAVTKGVTPVAVDLHVMSQCPYAVQTEAMFKDVLATLGPYVTFRVEYIGQNNSGVLSSMHGADEVAGDLAQVCAQKHSAKFFELVLCQNADMKQVSTNWEACADTLQIKEKKAIATCLAGPEGQTLLAESFTKSVDKGARGSPTIIIAGEKFTGTRKAASIMQTICSKFSGTVPEQCSALPEAPKVNVTILRDDRCTTCDVEKIEKSLTSKVSNPVVTKLDYGTVEGKKLFDEIKPTKLPALVFDATLDADADALATLKRGLQEVGSRKILSNGDWNPACADAGGCATDECKLSLECRPEVANRLDVFVMSQCPFGVKGMNAMEEVLANFKKSGNKIDFVVHFIGNESATGELTSLHGAAEVQEDLRQVCAISHYPKDHKFMSYILCRNKDIKSESWESCTGGSTGIDTNVIRNCSQGEEGKRLLKESFAYSKASGIGSSPTWLASGKSKFSGIDAETIKTQFCAANKVSGCAAKLSGPLPKPATP